MPRGYMHYYRDLKTSSNEILQQALNLTPMAGPYGPATTNNEIVRPRRTVPLLLPSFERRPESRKELWGMRKVLDPGRRRGDEEETTIFI